MYPAWPLRMMTPDPSQISLERASWPEENATGLGETLGRNDDALVLSRKLRSKLEEPRRDGDEGKGALGHGAMSPGCPCGRRAGQSRPLHQPYECGPPAETDRFTAWAHGCPSPTTGVNTAAPPFPLTCPQLGRCPKGLCTPQPLGGSVSQGLTSPSLSFLICKTGPVSCLP